MLTSGPDRALRHIPASPERPHLSNPTPRRPIVYSPPLLCQFRDLCARHWRLCPWRPPEARRARAEAVPPRASGFAIVQRRWGELGKTVCTPSARGKTVERPTLTGKVGLLVLAPRRPFDYRRSPRSPRHSRRRGGCFCTSGPAAICSFRRREETRSHRRNEARSPSALFAVVSGAVLAGAGCRREVGGGGCSWQRGQDSHGAVWQTARGRSRDRGKGGGVAPGWLRGVRTSPLRGRRHLDAIESAGGNTVQRDRGESSRAERGDSTRLCTVASSCAMDPCACARESRRVSRRPGMHHREQRGRTVL